MSDILGSTVYYKGRQYVVVGRCFRPPAKPVDQQHGQELLDLMDVQTERPVFYVEAEAVSDKPPPLVVA